MAAAFTTDDLILGASSPQNGEKNHVVHDPIPDLPAIPEQHAVFDQCSSPTSLTTGNGAIGPDKLSLTPVRSSTYPTHENKNCAEPLQSWDGSTSYGPRRSKTVAPPGQKSRLTRLFHRVVPGSTGDGPSRSPPRRNSTAYTKASASFEETAVWDRKAILSLDGGGIRGYSALLILRAIMREIGVLERTYAGKSATSDGPAVSSYHPLPCVGHSATKDVLRNPGCAVDNPVADTSPWLPCHYFDYMAGTSTGGLISIMTGRLRMNIDDCIRDYERLGAEVFGHSRWFHLRSCLWPKDKYNHKTLEGVIKKVVRQEVPKAAEFPGGRNFAFDENRCRVVVIAYQETKVGGSNEPYLFRTYKNLHHSNNPKESGLTRNPALAHDVPIWQVARATSAAPTYFKPAKIDGLEYLDGGFGGTNNPSLEIFDEVRIMNNNSSKCANIVVSVGTGKNNKVSRWTKSKLPLSRFKNYWNFAKKWASESESTHIKMKKEQQKFGFHYFRFNVEKGLDDMKLDEWRARGRMKIALGKSVGRTRRALRSKRKPKGSANAMDSHEKTTAADDSASSTTQAEDQTKPHEHSMIPKRLRPKMRTIETITRHTEAYLDDPDVQSSVKECARILVENRRQRAMNDPQRWEKACFDTWYQCNVDQCPRGEKEYLDRKKLEAHLLDKHATLYRKASEEEKANLEKALDDFKISMR